MDSGQLAAIAPHIERVGVWLAAILTLMVFSHLIKDNPLSRLAEHLFVGTAAGYAAVLAYHNVLRPKLLEPLLSNPQDNLILVVPAVLGLLLLLRPVGRLRVLASLPLAVVIGVGAGLAVAGAAAGTLIPQTRATMLSLDPAQGVQGVVNSLLIVVGVISTITYFFFTARQTGLAGKSVQSLALLGKWTMILAFGAVFASTFTARLALLVGRAQFLLGDWLGLLK